MNCGLKSRNSLTGRVEMKNYVSDTLHLRCLWTTQTENQHDANLTAQEKGLSKSGGQHIRDTRRTGKPEA